MTARELITALLSNCASQKISSEITAALAHDSSPALEYDIEILDEFTGTAEITFIDSNRAPNTIMLLTDADIPDSAYNVVAEI